MRARRQKRETNGPGARHRWAHAAFVVALLALPMVASAATPAASKPLQFRITEGQIQNAFYQDGAIAAHLLLSAGTQPRILVAFPAGNSGTGVWFKPTAKPVQWTLDTVRGKQHTVGGHVWNGIEATASVSADKLVVKDAVLSSIRVLRDYQLEQHYPAQVAAKPQVSKRSVHWQRERLDGAPGYAISLSTDNGTFAREHGHIVLVPDRAGVPIHLRIDASTGEPPLTPLAHLLNAKAQPDTRSQDVLRFLSYKQKFLAGSWRFDTYFGRDTLMSLRLLMPVLQPDAVDAGLGSVLARLSPEGEVAHEEGIGEFAVLQHMKDGGKPSDAQIYDYSMIDGNFMLAPVAAAWLLDDARGRADAHEFLAGNVDGKPRGAALVRNLMFVARSSAAFAKQPSYANLISLKPGHDAGQWRDSNAGLGGGRYPYDVNVVWVPAALRAIGRFLDAGLLDAYTTKAQRAQLRAAVAGVHVWDANAPGLFAVKRDAQQAVTQVRDYAASIGVSDTAALASLDGKALQFPAIALDAQGHPVPVLHTDVGFDLLFGTPNAATLDRLVADVARPFPAGLMTPIGMVVANPVYADKNVWSRFGNQAYHGTVVWSWQQAVMAAGLKRQLARKDLPLATRAVLSKAQTTLWQAICAAGAVRNSELWSWLYANGTHRIQPFGAEGAHEDESNAAQLWSTVYLALPPPPGIACH